jgi:hypothetical protein
MMTFRGVSWEVKSEGGQSHAGVAPEQVSESSEKEGEMTKGRLIGGIVCLVAAALLAVLVFALPEGKVVFMIGDSNVPWIPAIVLAGVGAGLLASAGRRQGA